MKQPLAGVVALLAAGILLGRWVPAPLIALFAVTLATGILSLRPRRTSPVWLAVFLVLIGWTNLAWRTAILAPHDLRRRMTDREQLATLQGILRDAPAERWTRLGDDWRTNTLATITCDAVQRNGETWEPAHGLVVISTPGPLPEVFRRGAHVRVSGVLRIPQGPSAPGLFDYGEYLKWRGIHFELRTEGAEDWNFSPGADPPPPTWSDLFQSWARNTLARGLPEQDRELRLVWAMTLGWKTGLTDDVEEPFVRSGTLHLFAISGLHIALIAEILVQVLRLVRVPRVAAGLVVIPFLWFYTVATGWQPSAVRATLMTSVVVGGWMLGRPVDLLNSLAVAAFAVLLLEPRELFQAGFQLSFTVVAAIGLLLPPLTAQVERLGAKDPFLPDDLVPRWQRWARRAWSIVGGSAALTIACWLGALPLTAYYFHLVNPISLLANLVVIPLGTASLASSLGSLACGDGLPAVGILFNHGAWLWMRGAVLLSEWFAAIPGGAWHVRQPPLPGVALWLVAWTGLARGAWRAGPARRVWCAAVGVLAMATLAGEWMERTTLRAVVIPLRGGHAVYVEHPEGRTLVDPGDAVAAEGVMRSFLQAQGVNRLEVIALTHGDVRHVGGTLDVLDRFPSQRVVVGTSRFRSTVYRRVVESLETNWNDRLARVTQGDAIAGWNILYPARDDKHSQADDAALVLARPAGAAHPSTLLLLSDLGRPGQQRLLERHANLSADIVITGLPVKGEPMHPEDLRRLGTRLLIVADALYPATARASAALRNRLRPAVEQTFFTSETGALEIRAYAGGWTVRDAAGRQLAEVSIADKTGVVAGHEIKDGHADRETVGDLLEDD